ncbi:AH receptor-interacting protein [Thrips palmi]|uniref:AH receptor-interacting protein n=1 Tax=Thrips palmi TaxID=161013 RepID=A0A6P8Y8Y3_THRPL|nr:AH receptor-interacting protein [Thrips palmi]
MSETPIQKKVLYAGKKQVEFKPGCKVAFHFITKLTDDAGTVIDDSRKMGKPMELVLGKKFKLEVWETIVQLMSLNEVASFTVDKSLVLPYPFVAKTLRDMEKPAKEKKHHCCGVTLQNEGLGYDDLNKLIKDPCDLEFIIELLKVEAPDEYKKESWQMSENEKLDQVPKLREEGNKHYKEQKYDAACESYSIALGFIEQLMLKEKPRDTEWLELQELKMPLLLNLSQCKLKQGDFYTVIEHCSTVLSVHPDNEKALFRRAKAHMGAWNPSEARSDFEKLVKLNPKLEKSVSQELALLEDMVRQKNVEDREKLAGKMFN